MKILIYSKILKDKDIPHVVNLLDALKENKMEVQIYTPYAKMLEEADLIGSIDYALISNYKEHINDKPDLVFTLGGDGTILNAIDIVRDSLVPIMGVNLGRLGFLSSIEKTKIKEVIGDVVKGEFQIEKRTMLHLECNKSIFAELPYALNDFTLHKRDTSSMITIHTYIDNKFLNSYWADGLVVSTATGSTGYSLSCGGPIMFPSGANIIITPVAPHNLNVRPIVISDDSKIRFEVEGRSENFLCTLDSRFETITSDYVITIKKSDFPIVLAHPNDITFMKTIRGKLMWGLDKRNH